MPPLPLLQENELRMSRRTLFGIMAGGTALWWVALRGSFPLAAVDKQKNVALLKTKGGNLVAATQVGQLAALAAPGCRRSCVGSCGSAAILTACLPDSLAPHPLNSPQGLRVQSLPLTLPRLALPHLACSPAPPAGLCGAGVYV